MKSLPHHRLHPLHCSAAILCFALSAPFLIPHADAATYTWDNNPGSPGAQDGSGIWNAAGSNWFDGTNNVPWTDGNDAVFGSGIDGNYAVTLELDPNATKLIFNNSGYTLSAVNPQTITVSNVTASITVAPGKTATIGANVTVSSPATSTNSALTGGGTLILENGGTLLNNGTANSNVLRVVGTAGGGTGTTLQLKEGGSFANSPANSALFVNGTLNVTGGIANLTGTLGIGQDSSDSAGTITLTSGTIFALSSNGIRFGSNSGTTPGGTLNLDGGFLTVTKLWKGTGTAVNSSVVNFNGATVSSSGGTTTFMEGLSRANVRNGGALIEAAQNITIKQDLLHSDITGDNAVDGGLTKLGSSTLTLTGTNTYTGGTTLFAGTLSVSTEANLGDLSGALRFDGGILGVTGTTMTSTTRSISWGASGGGFDIGTGNTFTVSQALAAGGGLIKRGAGTLILSGNNSYTGTTTLSTGILQLTNSNSAGTSAISGAANTQLQLANDLTLTNPIRVVGQGVNGDGALKVLNGNVTLTDFGVNSFDGTRLHIFAGSSLTITNNFALGDGASSQNVRAIGTGTLELHGDNSAVLVDASRTFLIGSGASAGPTIKVGNDLAFGAGIIDFQPNSGSTFQSKDTTAHTFANPVALNSATVILGASATGNLTFTGATTLGTSVTATINNSTTTFSGAISDTGAGRGLTKAGLGTLVLGGTNTYTGATIIDAGTLIVNGSLKDSALTVNSSGTLGGNGTVGIVDVLGGTVSPGDGPGTLNTGDFSLTSTSAIKFELAQAGTTGGLNDLISVTGNLTLDGTLQVTLLSGFTDGTYRLFNYTGTLNNNGLELDPAFLALYPGSSISTATSGAVNLVVVPEPSTGIALVGGIGMMLGFRRSRRKK